LRREGRDRVPLDRLATRETTDGPTTIQREWAKRHIVVQANVRGRDLGSFVDEVRQRIDDDVDLPDGWFVRYVGQVEHYERARTRLSLVVPMSLFLIGLLLYAPCERVWDALRVFTGVPFTAIGGFAALWLRDMPFSVSAAVGFVALSVLAGMVLVSTIRQHVDGAGDGTCSGPRLCANGAKHGLWY
jgi:cobalt-zinc-cadmium resistance protein CzcA